MGKIVPNRPTGSVFIRNFDQGVLEALGAVVRIDTVADQTGRKRNGYWIDDVFNAPTAVPVIFNNPEEVLEKNLYPCYLITRSTPFEPQNQRWLSVKSFEYVAGVSGTEESVSGAPGVSGFPLVSGFAQVEIKQQAWPVDLYYTVSCYARYEHEAVPMLKRMLKTFSPYSKISITDSLGEARSYTVFVESAAQDIGEFVDVADRLKAYSMDIRVEGELDVQDPRVLDTVGGIANTISPI